MNAFWSMMQQSMWMENSAKSREQIVSEHNERSARLMDRVNSPGYSKVKLPQSNGSYRVRRIYMASYLQYQQSDRAWAAYKALYFLSLAASVALSLWNGLYDAGLLEALSILPLLYLMYAVLYQLFVPRRMTIRQQEKASKHLKLGTGIYGGVQLLIFARLVYFCADNGLPVAAAPIAKQLVSTALILLIFVLELKRGCVSIPNDVELPEGAIIVN